MLKLLPLTTVLSVLLVPVLGDAAFAGSSPKNPPANLNSNVGTPICFMQTAGNRMLDLGHLCGASEAANEQAKNSKTFASATDQTGIRPKDFSELAATGKMWDVNSTANRVQQ